MKLNESSQKPLYVQMKEHLQSEINSGKYSLGEQLPPEFILCDSYGVSRITARKAISELVDEGILLRKQGKGTFVNNNKIERELVSVGSFSEITSSSGKNPRTHILSNKIVGVEQCEDVFDVDKNSNLLELHRLLYVDEKPFILETSYYPLQLLPRLNNYISYTESTYKTLNEKYNIDILSSYKTLNVIQSREYESEIFKCGIGTNLYQVEKIAYDQCERPIHFSESLFLVDRVTFTLSINK